MFWHKKNNKNTEEEIDESQNNFAKNKLSGKSEKELANIKPEEAAPSVEQAVKKAEEEVKKSRKLDTKYFYLFFFIVNVLGFSIFLAVNWYGTDKSLLTGSTSLFVVAIFCPIFLTIIEALRTYILIWRSAKKSRIVHSYASTSISKFYDLITPISKNGGQSHQISYLIKRGIKGSTATSIPVTRYVFTQVCFLAFIILFLASQQFGIQAKGAGVIAISVFAYIGLSFQFVWLAVLLFLSTCKTTGPAVVLRILKLAQKIKIIKDYKEVYIKVLHFVNDYQTTMKKAFKDPINLVLMTLLSVGGMMLKFSVPFFLYSGFFGYDPAMFVPILSMTVVVELTTALPILPGNVIIADLAFLGMFGSLFGSSHIFWALLFWRLITYYFFVFQGVFVIGAINWAAVHKQNKKLKKYYIKKHDNKRDDT